MITPEVSIVIPSHNRPEYLPRAVQSALECSGDSVEVIVVPNGPDASWKQSLASWKSDSRIRVSPIATAHGNAARNHGMMIARGKYLRFLDDDDYLLPDAIEQLDAITREDADVCSGLVVSVDGNRSRLGRTSFPTTTDFTVAALSLTGFALPTGHLYRRAAVSDCRWDERLDVLQDRGWLISLAGLRDLKWARIECEVGVWFQHESTRTSTATPSKGKSEIIIQKLCALPALLVSQNRIDQERVSAISGALWQYAHRGFPHHPFYWTGVARRAIRIDPHERIRHPLYDLLNVGPRSALLLEWLFIPGRHVTRLFRALNPRRSPRAYRRTV
jgi:hypothetical protein